MSRIAFFTIVLSVVLGCGGGSNAGDAGTDSGSGSGSALPASACTHVQDPMSACCERDGDCTAAQDQTCAPPGTPEGCGICQDVPDPCLSDDACAGSGSNLICDPVQCGCDDAKACVPGCTAATDCGDGQTCDLTTHRCAATPCEGSGASTCPASFACSGSACARVPCATGDACAGSAYCVGGACYAMAGECRSPVAIAAP
jgi:hypothetical protein